MFQRLSSGFHEDLCGRSTGNEGLGFRVRGLGFRGQGLGFEV